MFSSFPSDDDLLRSLFDTVIDPLVVIDQAGQLVAANQAVETVFGWSPETLVGQSINCLMPASVAAHHDRFLHQYLTSGQTNIIGMGRDLTGLHKAGHTFPMRVSVGHCRVGESHYFTGLIRDLTQEYQAKQLIARHEQILEGVLNSPDELIIVFDTDLKVVMVNESMVKFLNRDRASILGLTLASVIGSEMTRERKQLIESVVQTKHSVSFSSAHFGRYFDTQLSPVFDSNGDVELVTAFARDVSRLKKSKARLIKETKRAEMANRAKTEFLANMSHELRTPLNSVLGFAQILKDDPLLNEDQKDSMNYIHDAGDHLKRLIEDILDLARIESGNLAVIPTVIDVVEVLNEAVDLVSRKIQLRKLLLETDFLDAHAYVFADRTRLKQVFLNFLDNAIKYNVAGGSIHLKVVSNQERVTITIHDTGVGIAEEKQGALFEPFNRLGYESSGIPGTGIGLVLSKRLVERMGGSIDVVSEEGIGSRFGLTFPVAELDEKGSYKPSVALAAASSSNTSETLSVLYIEDDPSNIALMQRYANTKSNWQLTVAKEGLEGFQLAQQLLPDVILLDINLPDINGLELAVMLNSTQSVQDIPVVAVTADGTDETRRACEYAGLHIVMTKPIDFMTLEHTLEELVGL